MLLLRNFLLSTKSVHKFKHGHGLCTIAFFDVWRFTQNLSLLPFYPGITRGGRPSKVDQYTYGEAVRSVMKRQVEVKLPARAEGPRSKYFALDK